MRRHCGPKLRAVRWSPRRGGRHAMALTRPVARRYQPRATSHTDAAAMTNAYLRHPAVQSKRW